MKIHTVFALACFTLSAAEPAKAPPLLQPDDRYKADILLVVAHPDDDVVIGGYLARASLDDKKRIAVIYCTNGDGGGNAVGYEAGAALGQLRIMEARRATAFLGIDNVWFLGAHDTPGQDVLRSLDNWNHGKMLDGVVRIVRITRPEVILTFLPAYVVGENHDDHQAAGVLATEAFDMAGNPVVFPAQVSPPRDRVGMMNLTEGLHVWQPKKLYYFTDAFEDFSPYWHDEKDLSPYRKNFLDGNGPSYSNTAVSPSRHVSYARLNAQQQTFYLTQEGSLGTDAFKSNDFSGFEYPMRFIFGKSAVGGSRTGDIFEGVAPGPAAFVPVYGYSPPPHGSLSLELGGPWLFYREFWKAHQLEHLASLIPVPEASIGTGQVLHIPLLARNDTGVPAEIRVTAVLPPAWKDQTRYALYDVPPGQEYPVEVELIAPPSDEPRWHEIVFKAERGGAPVGIVTMRVAVGKTGGLPQ
jgi:LmbE family N-acetylglucosaminyl deacetylase